MPLAIFGVSAIIAGLLLLLLPETLHRRLPETIEDGLYLFRSVSVWLLVVWFQCLLVSLRGLSVSVSTLLSLCLSRVIYTPV